MEQRNQTMNHDYSSLREEKQTVLVPARMWEIPCWNILSGRQGLQKSNLIVTSYEISEIIYQ